MSLSALSLLEIIKKMLVTSDAWTLVCLYKQTSNQVYYIVNWRISNTISSLLVVQNGLRLFVEEHS